MKDGVHPKKNWIYCPQARKQKIRFDSQKKAQAFLRFNADLIGENSADGKKPVREYYCPQCCAWHVTSQPEIDPMLQRRRERQKAERQEYRDMLRKLARSRAEQISEAEKRLRDLLAAQPVYAVDIEDQLCVEDDIGIDMALEWDNWYGVARNGKAVSTGEIRTILEKNWLTRDVWDLLDDLSRTLALRKLGFDFLEDESEAEGEMDLATQIALYEKSFDTFVDSPAREKPVPVCEKSAPANEEPAPATPPVKKCLEWGRWMLPSMPDLDIDMLRARLELQGYDPDVWDLLDDGERIEIIKNNC